MLKETLNSEPTQAEFEAVIGPEQLFRIESTGATASIYNAISFVNNYCMMLPSDRYYSPKAEFFVASGATGFAAEILMPRSVRAECAKLRGPICANSVLAKREAAFGMLKLLHKYGEVDDHLRPHMMYTINPKTKLVEGNVQTRRLLPKRVVRDHKTKIPTAFIGDWVPGARVFLNILQFQHSVSHIEPKGILPIAFLSFGLISSQVCQEYEVFITGQSTTLTIMPAQTTLVLTEQDITQFRKYHYEFFKSVLRSEFDQDHPWATLCVPIIPEKASVIVDPRNFLDLQALDVCVGGSKITVESLLSGQYSISTSDVVAYDAYHYKRHYLLSKLQKEVTPESFPYSTYSSVAEFYKYRLECNEEINPDQPILQAVPVGYPYHSTRKAVHLNECPLIPQFTTISPILKKHIKCALVIPILLRSVTHRLLMMDVLQGNAFPNSVGRFNASLDQLTQAFTTLSANTHFNYDRIEFLGDSFLKLQLGLHLFILNPGRHEGYLSAARISLENNNYLRGNANLIQMEEFILSTSFSRKLWVPPAHNAKELQTISDKTVADVVEATIGASYLYGGIDSASDVVSYFIGSDEFYRNWDLYREKWKSYTVPTPILDPSILETCVIVSSRIGYTFKNVSILAEALTHSSAVSGASSLERLEYLGTFPV
jgi:endoribonuclease Dicer